MKFDKYGNAWPDHYVCCPACGQPDNCGDCNHRKLLPVEVLMLDGIPQYQGDAKAFAAA